MSIAQLAPYSPRQNSLLGALAEPDYQRLATLLTPVQLEAGQLLHSAGGLRHAWFPVTSILSLQYMTSHGAGAEVACIGAEGVAGLEATLAPDSPGWPLLARRGGVAWRMPLAALQEHMRACPALHALLMSSLQHLFAQLMQSAACSRHHPVEQQFCRCLLDGLDRHAGSELDKTQEFIASLLGVRRESVTEAARRLQQAGVIHYSRGHIRVLQRQALEQQACECYQALRRQGHPGNGRRIAA